MLRPAGAEGLCSFDAVWPATAPLHSTHTHTHTNRPPPTPQDLAEVLQEAAEAAGGRLQRVEEAAGYQLPAQFGPSHRAVQYTQLMSRLQEQAG